MLQVELVKTIAPNKKVQVRTVTEDIFRNKFFRKFFSKFLLALLLL